MSLLSCQTEKTVYLPCKAVDYVCKTAVNKFIKTSNPVLVDLKAVLKCKVTSLVP